MEMHQVRYFLAVADTLNFTRAAEECNVSQPSLSRAIKLLEAELGGELFRRERPKAQLTSLGTHMHPLLRQCYESAAGARSLARAIKKRAVGSLAVAVSRTIHPSVVLPHLAALQRQFQRLQIRLLRGTPGQVLETLKEGEVELAIAGDLEENWDRLDRWPLFVEPFRLVVGQQHRLANSESVRLGELREERLVLRPYCESTRAVLAACQGSGLSIENCDEIASEEDLAELLGYGLGAAIAPLGVVAPDRHLAGLPIEGLALERTVFLYGVAGRQRTAAANAAMKALRANVTLRQVAA